MKLQRDTVLYGLTPALTGVVADVLHWQSGPGEPVFSTVDDADASCLIAQLAVVPAVLRGDWQVGWPLLDWRAGGQSVVKNFYPDTLAWEQKVPDGPLIRIAGHGGGRWYAFDGGANLYEKKRTREHYLHFLVDGTSEPLVIYSQCAIYGDGGFYNVIRNSRNIAFYGVDDEPGGAGYLRVESSSNVFITGCGGNMFIPGNGMANFTFENCADITLSVASSIFSNSPDKTGETWLRVRQQNGDVAHAIRGDRNLAYFRIGGPGQ